MDTNKVEVAEADRPRRVIKRYSNRKLYDTKDSRDVTLVQIVYEEKKANSRTVPLQTLKDLIHQRTEKVLSDLREGPIGRLIPGGKAEGAVEEAAPPPPPVVAAPPPAASPAVPKASLVDQAKLTFEEWQHRMDDRIKSVVPNLLPWADLEQEVKRLSQRVEELEAKLKSGKN